MKGRLRISFPLLKRRVLQRDSRLFLLLVFFALSACARQPRIAVEVGGEEKLPASVFQKISSIENVQGVRAVADCALTLKGKRRRFQFAFAAIMPDVVMIDLFDRLAGSFSTIVSAGSNERMEGLPWAPAEAIRIVLGSPPSAIKDNSAFPCDAEGRFWVIPERGAIKAVGEEIVYYEVKDGRVFAEVHWSDYKDDGGIFYPKRIVVEMFRPRTTFEMEIVEIEFNKNSRR